MTAAASQLRRSAAMVRWGAPEAMGCATCALAPRRWTGRSRSTPPPAAAPRFAFPSSCRSAAPIPNVPRTHVHALLPWSVICNTEAADRMTGEQTIHVAVVEDDRVTRDGLKLLIDGTPGFRCQGA